MTGQATCSRLSRLADDLQQLGEARKHTVFAVSGPRSPGFPGRLGLYRDSSRVGGVIRERRGADVSVGLSTGAGKGGGESAELTISKFSWCPARIERRL